MDTTAKPAYVAEGLVDLLIATFGKFNKSLPTYYALIELVLRKSRFKIAEIRDLLKLSPKLLPSTRTLNKRMLDLVQNGIIVRNRIDKRTKYTYDLSDKALNMLIASKRYFRYFSDARDKRNGVVSLTINPLSDAVKFGTTLPPMSGHDEWEFLMEPGIETEQFLQAYRTLTSQRNIYLGDRSIDLKSRVPYAAANLPRQPFRIDQPPERFGRIGSNPYAFVGKSHLPDLHPVHDPGLKHGRQFMVDFSSFEPRILAFFTRQPELLEIANSADDMYEQIHQRHLNNFPISDKKRLILAWINGAGVQGLSEFINVSISSGDKSSLAMDIMKKLHCQFPEIEALRVRFASQWVSEGEFITPDGTRMPLHYTKKNNQGIKELNSGERSRKSLALILQTYSGLLGRQIISEAQNLKFAYLRLCVYDGFMFYCEKEHYETALIEVSELLSRVSNEIFPSILMPFKLEWWNDDSGVNYGDSYLPSRDGMNNINIIPSLTSQQWLTC